WPPSTPSRVTMRATAGRPGRSPRSISRRKRWWEACWSGPGCEAARAARRGGRRMATLIVVEDLAGPASLGRGGHAMYVLQWLHGLERLGHRVLFVEFLNEDPGEARPSLVRYFRETVESWWHPEHAALLVESTGESL